MDLTRLVQLLKVTLLAAFIPLLGTIFDKDPWLDYRHARLVLSTSLV